MSDTLTTDTTEIPAKRVAAVESDRGPGLFQRGRGFESGTRKGAKYLVRSLLGGGFIVFAALAANGVGTRAPTKEEQAKANDALLATQAAGLSTSVPDALGYSSSQTPPRADGSATGLPGQQNEGAVQAQRYDYEHERQPGGGHVVPAIGAEPSYNAPSPAYYAAPGPAGGQMDPAPSRAESARRAPVMALLGSEQSRDDRGGASSYGEMERAPPPRSPNELEQRLEASQITAVRGRAMPHRNFLITAGTQIPCVLQTALDSSQPGLASCMIPSPVFSDNGRVILLDKGTRVLGEYRGGLQQGQNRLFVVWNRAITPRGVSISLGSPAADALGRAGMPGRTETFFWKRFGGALLLSIVGDAGSAASNRLSGVEETSRVPSNAAAAAVENDIRIQPVLRARQGAEMTIFAARDFDFSNVYSLRLRR